MNNYTIHPNFIEVEINSPKYGLKYMYLDLDNLWLLKDYNWHLKPENNGNFYAHTNFYVGNKRTGSSIHRMICPQFSMIDHIDGNGLNNRKQNLRNTTYKLNNKNKTKRKNGSSKYKGVYKKNKKWAAKICLNYKNIHLGVFISEKEAAKAYNEAVLKYYGNDYIINILEV